MSTAITTYEPIPLDRDRIVVHVYLDAISALGPQRGFRVVQGAEAFLQLYPSTQDDIRSNAPYGLSYADRPVYQELPDAA